jgi:glutathione S-transferase-like protein
MKLYVCYGTFTKTPRPGGHPCGNAHRALKEAGHDPEVIRTYGLGMLPDVFNRTSGRQEVKRLTGNNWVPVLVTDDGEVIQDSKKIVQWAREHPAGAPVAA